MFGKQSFAFSRMAFVFSFEIELSSMMNNHLIILEMDAVAFLDYHGKTPEELSFGIDQKISLKKRINPSQVASRTVYDVLPNSMKVYEHSTSPEDLNRTLHDIFSDVDPPDLVLNLPVVHSTIIIDVNKKKIPPPVMKKTEKTMQLIQRLGLVSLSASSKVTEV